jgi:hypothetical protein
MVRNRSRIDVEIRLPSHDLEEPMVKILERLPSVQNLRVRRAGSQRPARCRASVAVVGHLKRFIAAELSSKITP